MDDDAASELQELLRQIKRIKTHDFVWDKDCPQDSRIYPVIVLADYRQTASGLKNLLDIWMREEAAKENATMSFSDYINHQRCYGMKKWLEVFIGCLKKAGIQ